MDYIYTNSGVDSLSSFPFRAQADPETQSKSQMQLFTLPYASSTTGGGVCGMNGALV